MGGDETSSMSMGQGFHTKEGTGEDSYANNCRFQKMLIDKVEPMLEESLRELCTTMSPECLVVADLGCSSGPNALLVLSRIINTVDIACMTINRCTPEFKMFVNDLPGNDFNTIFKLLSNFQLMRKGSGSKAQVPIFVSGTPGSFYGRLFPRKFLHFVHSSFSLHWLSQVPTGLIGKYGVPVNIGNIQIGHTSPPEVHKAYYNQFAKDFTLFLSSRSQELIEGGRMVLALVGSDRSSETYCVFDVLSQAMRKMVTEGLIDENQLDGFNIPCYLPTMAVVTKLVEAEGSFKVENFESFIMEWADPTNKGEDLRTKAKFQIDSFRAAAESLFTCEFREEVVDQLFDRAKELMLEHIIKEKFQVSNLAISMTKKAVE